MRKLFSIKIEKSGIFVPFCSEISNVELFLICPNFIKKYIYTLYIYSKRCVLHFFAIYPPAILRLWYGYPTVRVRSWLVLGVERVEG